MSFTISPTVLDRLWAAFRVLVRAEDPNREYRAAWEYIVQATNGSTVDAIPADPTVPMPQLTGVTLRYGIPGTTAQVMVGSRLAIAFLNGDPTKPIVLGVFDQTTPLNVSFAGQAPLPPKPVGRVGDAVGPFVITTGSTLISAGG